MKSSTDDPTLIDWRELSRNSKAGRMILSTGPFLEVETGSGIIAGGHDRTSGPLKLKVKVQCSDWLDIDRVQVLVNGRQVPETNFTREENPEMFADDVVKFDQVLELELTEDAHLIVVAVGENHSLETGFGTSGQAKLQPIAYHNPIFIDPDALNGPLESRHAAADGAAFKGGSGGAGCSQHSPSAVDDKLGVRPDIHDGSETIGSSQADGQQAGGGIRSDMAAHQREAADPRLREDREAELLRG